MRELPIHKSGQVIAYTLVDDDVFEAFGSDRWYLNSSGYAHRAKGKSPGGEVYLHRLITKAPKDMDVDHINGSKLDNRRENLRVVTHSQNHQAKFHPRGKYNLPRGVKFCPDKKARPYLARAKVMGREYRDRYYATAAEAAEAARQLRARLGFLSEAVA